MQSAAFRTLLQLLATGRMTLILLLLISSPAMAGFGDLLKKIESSLPATQSTDQTDTHSGSSPSPLDATTLSAGLKEALRVSSERAVQQVSAADGYLANPAIHIPLPPAIAQVAPLLDRVGLSSLADQFETSMNRAAEQAAPAAARHLQSALENMTLDDAQRIFQGPDDAATRYFEQRSAASISQDFLPIVKGAMDQVGVATYYRQLVDQAARYPLLGSMAVDIDRYVTDEAVAGLFTVLAEQEALIRKDPVARSTDLLKQVFGR